MEYNLIMIIAALQIVLVLVGAIGAVEYMNAPPSKPKRARRRSAFAGLALLFLAIPGVAMAQGPVSETRAFNERVANADDKPVPKVEKPLPAKVTIPAEKVRGASLSGLGAENAALKMQLLEARIQKAEADLAALPGQIKEAKEQLEKLKDAAKKTNEDAQMKSRAMFEAAGIPSDKLDQYDVKENPDGSLELTKKVPAKKE